MSAVKVAVAGGIEPGAAVKAALGMTIQEFANTYGVRRDTVSSILGGKSRYPYHETRDAIAEHLGVSREWLDDQIPLPEDREATG